MKACLAISLVLIFINLNNIDSFHKSTKFKNIIENTVFDKNKIIELIKEVQLNTIYTENANVNIIDLNKELEPENIYRDIKCRKSAKFIIETTLCIHPLEKDMAVSGRIWKFGVWEEHILRKFV